MLSVTQKPLSGLGAFVQELDGLIDALLRQVLGPAAMALWKVLTCLPLPESTHGRISIYLKGGHGNPHD